MHKWGQTDNGTDLTKQHCRFFPVICITVIFYDDIGKRLPGAGETLNSQEHTLLFQTTQLPFPELPSATISNSSSRGSKASGLCRSLHTVYELICRHTHIYRQLQIFFFKNLKKIVSHERTKDCILQSWDPAATTSHLKVRAKCRCETKVLGSGAPETSRTPESETSLEPGFPREKTRLSETGALITALGNGCINKLVFNLNTLIARKPYKSLPTL